MVQLHIWGKDQDVSVISPESLACVWLVSSIKDIDIVSSNNTNISQSGQLPVLITETNVILEGYANISNYICENYAIPEVIVNNSQLSNRQKLMNMGLMTFIDTKLKMINQYNLYISPENYEKFTRKLFKHYLPFPMMYNQPLKFYNTAQQEVKTVGIGEYNRRFLWGGAGGGDDDDDDNHEFDNTAPISKLHERQLLAKNNKALSVRDKKNTLRAMNLLDEYLNTCKSSFDKFDAFDGQLTTGQVLFYAYLVSICCELLPDQVLHEFIRTNHKDIYEQFGGIRAQLDKNVAIMRPPTGHEVPSLINEIYYRASLYK